MDGPLSLTDFLTDGSVASLCDAISRLTGRQVTVRDQRGRRIVHVDEGGSAPWRVMPPDASDADLVDAIAKADRPGLLLSVGSRRVCPLFVAGEAIGALVIHGPPGDNDEALEETICLLVSTIGELCEHEYDVRARNRELRLLYRLSSLLVASRDIEAILQVTLRSAIEIFQVDAGSVHLLNADGSDLTLRAHVGLSPDFVAEVSSIPLHTDMTPATSGSETASALIEAGRARIVRAMHARGMAGLISGGLAFNDRALGVIRLYAHDATVLDPQQHALLQTMAELVSASVAGVQLIEDQRRHRQMDRQLRLARDVQRRMLPPEIPDVQGLDIAARYISCFDLGGDFYDLIDLKSNLGITVGDVSGKGVPAALLMASVRASLRAHAQDVYHLDDVMRRVNQAMTRDTLDNEFATIFYGVIDLKTRRLTYCNAGHEPPYIIRTGQGRVPQSSDVFRMEIGGMSVGIDAAQVYERGMFDLEPGDVIIAYSDGVMDAMNFAGEKFGRPRLYAALMSLLASDPRASAKAIADHIVWEMRRFIGLNPETDDTTIVVVRVR